MFKFLARLEYILPLIISLLTKRTAPIFPPTVQFWHLKGDVTRDDSQRRFLAQHSVVTLLRHCFECLRQCSTIATLYCAKNRRCETSRVTSP